MKRNDAMYRCATCPHFIEQDGLSQNQNIVAGLCHGIPPATHMIPIEIPPRSIERIAKPQMALAPSPYRPPVMADDPGCHLHPLAVWAADQDKWARIEAKARENMREAS
jgi:hypothetical protein